MSHTYPGLFFHIVGWGCAPERKPPSHTVGIWVCEGGGFLGELAPQQHHVGVELMWGGWTHTCVCEADVLPVSQ